jgi:hypothetical protein
MADSIRGDGLLKVHSALADLLTRPELLNQQREQFSEYPAPKSSHQSLASTRSESPGQPSDEQQRYEERKWRLIQEYEASFPSNQFRNQTSEERTRIVEAELNGTQPVPVGTDFLKFAEANVKARWLEQGIWDKRWDKNGNPGRNWKHERSLDLESELEVETKANLFSLPSERKVLKRKRNRKHQTQIIEQKCVREREREASRPINQFFYQISKEREYVQHFPLAPDVNTVAYERVKSTWERRGIWDRRWIILPGMSWKHEQPLEDMLREEMGEDAISFLVDTLEDDMGLVAEKHISTFAAPSNSNHQQPNSLASFQPPSTNIPGDLMIVDANRSPALSKPTRVHAARTRESTQQKRRQDNHTILSHSSKVLKNRDMSRRLSKAPELSNTQRYSLDFALKPPDGTDHSTEAENKPTGDPSSSSAKTQPIYGYRLRSRCIGAVPITSSGVSKARSKTVQRMAR